MRIASGLKELALNLPDSRRSSPAAVDLPVAFQLARKEEEPASTGNYGEPREKDKLVSEGLKKIIEEMQEKFNVLNRYLKLEVDQEADVTVVKIIDKRTNEVIRQVPPEYILEIKSRFRDLHGLLVNERI